jgi:hypothetical protein
MDCWLSKWVTALSRIVPDTPLLGFIRNMVPLPMGPRDGVLCSLRASYESMLESFGDPFDMGSVQHRRIGLHVRVMWNGRWGERPWWHWCKVSSQAWRCWVRFLACQSDVPAQNEVGVTAYANRLCVKCRHGCVGHEAHVLLMCDATAMVRASFYGTLIWPWNNCLRLFLAINRNETCMKYVFAACRTYALSDQVAGQLANP